jgi:hypothetical protein
MSNNEKQKDKYSANSIGGRIAELMLEKLTNNNDNDKQPNQTNNDGTSNDQKSLQGQGKKK